MHGLYQSPLKELNLPSNHNDIVQKFSCNSDSPGCMNSKCKECRLPGKIAGSGGFETDNITEYQ